MNNLPKVSIILPYKDSQKFLKEAIQSILNQTFGDWELLLINNGSSDQSSSIAKKYKTIDSRIHCFEFFHRGVAAAFNYGFRKSSGQVIARMDSDDIAHPERIEKQYSHIVKNNFKGLFYSKVKPLGEAPVGWLRYLVWQNSISTSPQIYLDRFVEMPVCNPTLMASKKVFSALGLYNEEEYPEDYELFLRACSMGIPIEKHPDFLFSWRDHPARLTRGHPGYSRQNFFEIKARYLFKYSMGNNPAHPIISVWGTGQKAKKYIEVLLKEGFNISRFFDLKPGLFSKGKIESYHEINPNGFLITLVSNRNAGKKIEEFLNSKGMKNGQNFILAG